jgi:hypothetical protein
MNLLLRENTVTMHPVKFLLQLSTAISLLMLGGCSWFNSLGEHFPVIGERCEYWQCFTESGRQQSDAIRQAKEKAATQQSPGNPAPPPVAVPAGEVPASQAAPPSHVQFIDPGKSDSADPTPPSASWQP